MKCVSQKVNRITFDLGSYVNGATIIFTPSALMSTCSVVVPKLTEITEIPDIRTLQTNKQQWYKEKVAYPKVSKV